MGEILIRAVETKADKEAFLRLPYRIYAQDPHWVAPLLMERREHLSPKNPFFAHAEVRFWLAYRNGEPVGRISAQVDSMHVERHGRQGHFGLLEAFDDPAVFDALLRAAEDWLRTHNMVEAVGPASLSVNDEFGLLVHGFDSRPRMLMNYARPYYAAHLEAAGYAKVKGLNAYIYDLDVPMPKQCNWMAKKASANPRVRFRKFDRKRMREDIHLMVDIFNDAWTENWAFVPMTKAEVDHMAAQIRPLLVPELGWFAEVDGRAVAMIIALPDLHEALQGLNGKLTPVTVIKLLWRLKVSRLKSTRVVMMGVRKELQDSFMSGSLTYALIDIVAHEGRKRGVKDAELSWVLEDNTRMGRIIETVAGAPYKHYRLYGKTLG